MEQLNNGTPKRNGNVQLNFNTVLLAICVGLSGWALKSIEDLKTQLAGEIPIINANSGAIIGIDAVDKDQSYQLEQLSIRVATLEAIQSKTQK